MWQVYIHLYVAKVLEQITLAAFSSVWWDASPFENCKLPRHVNVARQAAGIEGSLAHQHVLHFASTLPPASEGTFLHTAKELLGVLGAPWDPFSYGAASTPALLCWHLASVLLAQSAAQEGATHCIGCNSEHQTFFFFFKPGFPLPQLPSCAFGSCQLFRFFPQSGSVRAF